VLTAVPAIFFPYDVPTKVLVSRAETRKRCEKCTSEILVYGFILAPVKHKT
jgi:hypothetical protein